MARFLTAILIVFALVVTLFWLSAEESPVIDSFDPAVPPQEAEQSERRPSTMDELEVQWTRRSTVLDLCHDPDAEKSEEELLAEFKAQQEQMLRVLGQSDDVEHLMVAALVSWLDDADGALLLLGEAAGRDPGNPMVASQLLALCLELGHCSGARAEMERNLIAADKGNVLAWVQVARSRLSRDDERAALSALREAAAAAVVEDYSPEYVMTFERALAASSSLGAHERMRFAFGHAATVFWDSYMISADCRARAPISAEWGDLCVRVGERLESDGRTILVKAIGIGMQVSMYELSGDSRALERVMKRQRDFRASYRPLISQSARGEELNDATVLRKYLEIFDTKGEIEAMQYLAEEVEARLPQAAGAEQESCQTP